MLTSTVPLEFSGQMVREAFVAMFPRLTKCLRMAFGYLRGEQQEVALQETLANAFVAFARLCERGLQQRAFPTVLAKYAVAQWHDGRRVGCSLNVQDVSSSHAQRRQRFVLERLDHWDQHADDWRNALVADRQTPIPDQVWFRIDFPEWLSRLSSRDRQIAELLAQGEATLAVARQFAISNARVSQLRHELQDSWERFQGEGPNGLECDCAPPESGDHRARTPAWASMSPSNSPQCSMCSMA